TIERKRDEVTPYLGNAENNRKWRRGCGSSTEEGSKERLTDCGSRLNGGEEE
ncbi:hypothetical protein A2U01_0104225, partial [Trifolium medium]|nr:hypothetical protein [Trifolium medium]